MSSVLYTLPGCSRCKIIKRFLEERGISFEEKDIKGEGKDHFQKFYTANRQFISRGPEGIKFPIFTDGSIIRQGCGAVLAYLHSGNKLDGFFSVETLRGEWLDGIHISTGDPRYAEDFLAVLRYLKKSGLKLQVDTNGKNSVLLRRVLEEKLAEAVIMHVLGPPKLYSQILGEPVEMKEIEESITIVPQFPQYRFVTTVVPLRREDKEQAGITYMTPEEIAETAKLIEEVTGSKKHPYFIRPFKPEEAREELFQDLEPLSPNMLLRYRTAARAYQVFAEIENIAH